MNDDVLRNYRFSKRVPHGDDKERLVCGDCGWVHYVNPVIVVGAVVHHGDQLLLCKRAIEPRRGFWTMPAGYMEAGETTEHGACREAFEEARARIEIEALLGVYAIARINQVQLIYRARLVSESFAAGEESLEVKLFTWDEIPWNDLAFPTVRWALDHFAATRGRTDFAPFTAPIE
jgi:ADP-ribose pyrophosphatase YjhB (NUDIX family)